VRRIPGPLPAHLVVAQVAWAVGVDETRAVFERENTDGAVWTPTGDDYDEFLWYFVVEAVFGGDSGAGANNVDADGFQRLTTAWARSTCAHGAGQGRITAYGSGTACSPGPS
jgi:hypothetical protein